MKATSSKRSWLAPAFFLLSLIVVLVALFWPGGKVNESGPGGPGLKTVRIEISGNGLSQIQAKRDEALQLGILQTRSGDWVKAVLKEGKVDIPGKIRLKGDWPDHLQGEKWSFRVKLDEGHAWSGLKVFSLHNPESRNFLMEWLFHQFLIEKGILTTRYDFVHLYLNEKDLGIYAIEEHFSPELLSAQARLPGPLIKLSEEGVWELRAYELRNGKVEDCEVQVFNAATISAFGTTGSEENSQAFGLAQNLLDQARFRTRPHRELFDLDLAARRHAATDLFRAFHSLTWHNQRWYYNPVTGRLEPVVYDGYPGTDLRYQFQGPFSGFQASGLHIDNRYAELMDAPFFEDSLFLERYYHHLFEYSQRNMVLEFLDSLENEIRGREAFLQEEFRFFTFDRSFLLESAGQIQTELESVSTNERNLGMRSDGEVLWLKNNFPFPLIVIRDGKVCKLLHARDPEFPPDSVGLSPEEGLRIKIPGTELSASVDRWR